MWKMGGAPLIQTEASTKQRCAQENCSDLKFHFVCGITFKFVVVWFFVLFFVLFFFLENKPRVICSFWNKKNLRALQIRA